MRTSSDLNMNDPEVDEIMQRFERCDRIVMVCLAAAAFVAVVAAALLIL